MTMIQDDAASPLRANARSCVIDPALASVVEEERQAVANSSPTSGPNRFTLHVPTENTVLSLGALSPDWQTDMGITGYTESHIDFEVKAEGAPQTIVSLGGPSKLASITECVGDVPRASHGYSMVTNGNAWHDAILQHHLVSNTADMAMRTAGEGRRAVIQADAGTVDICAQQGVNLSGKGISIGANADLTFDDIDYNDPWGKTTPTSWLGAASGVVNGITNAVVAVIVLAKSAKHSWHEHGPGKLHATESAFADYAEWLLDAKETYQAGKEVVELFKEEEVEDKIRICAQDNFGVSAGMTASFFGGKAASLAATVWTSVSGVVSASLAGNLFAGVCSAYTSIKGYIKVTLASDTSDVVIEAAKGIAISPKEHFIAVGKENAQVLGEVNAIFTGATRAWLGVAAGETWGVLFDEHGAAIGKASGAKTMSSATIVDAHSIKVTKLGIVLTSESNKISILEAGVTGTAGSIDIQASGDNVVVKAAKIHINTG